MLKNFNKQRLDVLPMLSKQKVDLIDRLAKNNLSFYAIAKEVGCNVRTVERYLGVKEQEDAPLSLGKHGGYRMPSFPDERQDGYCPQPQYRPNIRSPRMNAEMAEIISYLDRYDEVYGMPPQTPQERFEEEEKLRQWQSKRREEQRNHELEMDSLRNMRYHHPQYTR